MSAAAGTFAAVGLALYAGHHIGDYWVQTDHQAKHKGDAGADGVLQCVWHVLSYVATQAVMLAIVDAALGLSVEPSTLGVLAALLVSGGTHYMADRREHGAMFWLARKLPGKANFLKLGVPREPRELELLDRCPACRGTGNSYDESTGGMCWDCRGSGFLPTHITLTDNPSLGTGAWALDQSWHIFWGVFVAALLAVIL